MARRLPSREIAGGSTSAPSTVRHSCELCPAASTFQRPSAVPLAARKNSASLESRGALARPVGTGSGYGLASFSIAMPPANGTRHRLALGLAIVATMRRPSRLAEIDMYWSTPVDTFVTRLRLMSSDHNHGPDPSSSRATYN